MACFFGVGVFVKTKNSARDEYRLIENRGRHHGTRWNFTPPTLAWWCSCLRFARSTEPDYSLHYSTTRVKAFSIVTHPISYRQILSYIFLLSTPENCYRAMHTTSLVIFAAALGLVAGQLRGGEEVPFSAGLMRGGCTGKTYQYLLLVQVRSIRVSEESAH